MSNKQKEGSSFFSKLIAGIVIVVIISFIANNCSSSSHRSVYDEGEYNGVLRGRD